MTQYLALMSAARLGHKRAGYLGIFTGANRGTSFVVVQHRLCNHSGGALVQDLPDLHPVPCVPPLVTGSVHLALHILNR